MCFWGKKGKINIYIYKKKHNLREQVFFLYYKRDLILSFFKLRNEGIPEELGGRPPGRKQQPYVGTPCACGRFRRSGGRAWRAPGG